MPSAKLAARLVDAVLFRCHLKAARFKDMIASAKAIGETVCIEVNSSEGGEIMRYWADDADRGSRPICAMVGAPSHSMFSACEGDDETHAFRVPAKHLVQCISAFDPKRDVEMRLLRQESKLVLTLQQAKDDESDPDVRSLSVEPTDAKPVIPTLTKSAYAPVDLKKLAKVLGGLKQSTNIVTVRISPGEFEVQTSTRSLQDGWKHASTTEGRAEGIFAVTYLKKVVTGAKAGDAFGEIHLAQDSPLHISSVSEDLTIDTYVASSEVMK